MALLQPCGGGSSSFVRGKSESGHLGRAKSFLASTKVGGGESAQ